MTLTGSTPYDEIAEWYDAWVGSDDLARDPFFPAVEALMGDVARQRICDLACGQGRVARHLAILGAQVIGVDVSDKLLEIARRRERLEPRGIDYRHSDARTLRGIPDAQFDGVVCFLALMDIPDLIPAIQSVARTLRPGGWFIFAVLHPCYNTPRSDEMPSPLGWTRVVGSYFTESHWISDKRTGPPGKVGAYHRTLSTYFNALLEAGFQLEQINEPQASGARVATRPIWTEVPAVLIAKWRKGPVLQVVAQHQSGPYIETR
jgi:ubiquinone/menaquinone biosynthesis C-methylase UbiE